MSVYEMTQRELWQDYADDIEPEDLINIERNEIAEKLMSREHGLDQEAAYYAADQILEYAHRLVSERR